MGGPGSAAIFLWGLLLASVVAISLLGRRWLTRTPPVPVAGELSLYQVALLAGGPARAADTALAYLAWSGMIEVREAADRLARPPGVLATPDLHPVELSVLEAVDPLGVRPEAAMAVGRRAARQSVGGLDGLVVGPIGRAVDLAVVGGCALVGGWAGWRGLISPSGEPGTVALVALLALFYAGWWMTAGRPRLTRAGQAALESVRGRYDHDLALAAVGVTSLPLDRAMPVIALYGRDALTGGLSGLRKVMTGNPAPVLLARSSLVR